MILQQLRFRVVSLQKKKRFFSGFSVLDYTAQKRYFSSAYKNPPNSPKTILAGEGPPPPERGTGDADALLKSSSPSISTSKLKAVVFDMSVLVLQNPEKDGGAGGGEENKQEREEEK